MKTLTLSRDTFDHASKFRVAGVSGDVSLERDYNTTGDGILWGLQHGVCIQSSYTAAESEHIDRMNQMDPIRNGECVEIDGRQYRARILGNYSDCVIFDPVG